MVGFLGLTAARDAFSGVMLDTGLEIVQMGHELTRGSSFVFVIKLALDIWASISLSRLFKTCKIGSRVLV